MMPPPSPILVVVMTAVALVIIVVMSRAKLAMLYSWGTAGRYLALTLATYVVLTLPAGTGVFLVFPPGMVRDAQVVSYALACVPSLWVANRWLDQVQRATRGGLIR